MNERFNVDDEVIIIKNRWDVTPGRHIGEIAKVIYVQNNRNEGVKICINGNNFYYDCNEIIKINTFRQTHKFEIGNKVIGNLLGTKKYNITTSFMLDAIVLDVVQKDAPEYDDILIKIINHETPEYIGKIYNITADCVDINMNQYSEDINMEYDTNIINNTENTENKLINILQQIIPDATVVGYRTSRYSDNLFIIVDADTYVGNDYMENYINNYSEFNDIYTNRRCMISRTKHKVVRLNLGILESNNLHICRTCEKIHALNNDYCKDCLTTIPKCNICGKRHSDIQTISNLEDTYICRECIRMNRETYVYCNHCGNYFYRSPLDEDMYNSDGEIICAQCNEYFFTCDTCGNRYYDSNDDDEDECSGRHTHSGHVLCLSCYERITGYKSNPIYGYHGFSNWQPYGEDTEIHFGFELEVENISGTVSNNTAANKVMNIMNDKVICSRDGSINNGFEIVSHPMTFNYLISIKNEIKTMMEWLSANGFQSHNPGTCGLHFHISRKGLQTEINTEDETINNILMLFENFKNELTCFSRRKNSDLERWAQFLSTYRNLRDNDIITLDYIKQQKGTSTRYMALNLQNSKTIEMRLFRGTLNFDTFIATFQLVNNIVNYASQHSDITGCTWAKLTNTNSKIKQYTKLRGIESRYKKASNVIIKLPNTRTRNNADRREV